MSTVSCTACGKQYPFSVDIAGKQVRCRACNNVFLVPQQAGDGLDIVDAYPVAGGGGFSGGGYGTGFGGTSNAAPNRGGRKADEIEYEIYGSEMQFAEITLDPGEMVIAEAGGMMYMTSGIKMETVFGDPSQQQQGFWGKMMSAGKRMLTGESIFMTTFTAASHRREQVAFASPYPGKIIPLHLDRLGGELICQKDAFLCGARGIQVSIAFQKKIMVGLFGGEGFIMQKLLGDGIALVHAGGTLWEKDLAPGETIKVDTGCIVALMPSVNYDIGFVGGFKNTLFGGEGLFLATLTGPGKIWLQSLPFSRLAGRVLQHAGGKSSEEGSVLNHLGGLGNMVMGGD